VASNFYGGPEKQILEHGLRLQEESEFNFCLVSFAEGDRVNELLVRAERLGISTRALHTANPFNPKVVIDLVHILKVESCDLLVTHGYKANIIGRLATWLLRLPQVSISRGWTAENLKVQLYENLDRIALRFMEHVVAVSEGQLKKLLVSGLNSKKVSAIHNAVELGLENIVEKNSTLRTELNIDKDTLLVVGAGRMSPEKNFRGFIEAAHIVLEREPRVIFVIFGEGVLHDELARQVQVLGLESRILLPGFRRNLASLLSEADIFFQSSFTEGLPNVLLEAFAAKLPVVATDVGGTAEVVKEGRSGFLVPPEDKGFMAERILQLLKDPQMRTRMGKVGYEFVRDELNFSRQTALYRKLYREILRRDNVGPSSSRPEPESNSSSGMNIL
jgi:glycosyltransferase involved in cell wall biosynthesis